ncbi:MAG: RnfABCDGE type electron transport complex subunit G [Butyrivibrio sp.]|nr:RnfABCDGE type electron transport complex subunit G [Muribaculum sp.]MCM1551524.1 RnfABCDGE type electron transport complex subunit G [Butyrivibrio sp.]
MNYNSKNNSKNNSDVAVMLREAGILFAITLIAGVMLGFVYELTKEPIRIQQEKAVQEACMAVFPDSGENLVFEQIQYAPEPETVEALAAEGVEIGSVYSARMRGADDTLAGYVVESVTSEGYGGEIVLYVGVAIDGSIGGVSILDISETPGLGMEAPKVLTPQFAGKSVESFTYTKTGSRTESEVDAISGATITTKAVVNAVNGALRVTQNLLSGGGANE